MLGQGIDDALAEQLTQDTRSDITFLTATHVFAASLMEKEKAKEALLSLVVSAEANLASLFRFFD